MARMHQTDDIVAPSVSVVIVSDYEAGDKDWADERKAVRAFIEDNPAVPFEIIVMESLPQSSDRPVIPADIAGLAPLVSVHFDTGQGSAALKDAALKHCSSDLVAVVEADSLPQPGWLARLLVRLQSDPSLDVVSGRTIYGTDRAMHRVMSLLDRGFIEPRRNDECHYVCNNGALYRRHVLEQYPYPDDPNPFVSAELRNTDMHRGRVRMGFEPNAVMRHAYGGISFLAEVRQNKGYQAARRILRKRPHAARQPTALVALRAVAKCWKADLKTVRTAGARYLRLADWPLLGIIFVAVRVPEFIGALSVHRPEAFADRTKYR